MSEYVIVGCDDWMSLYKDGRSIYQGHSIDLQYFCELLELSNVTHKQAYGWMDSQGGGGFPNELEDVTFDE